MRKRKAAAAIKRQLKKLQRENARNEAQRRALRLNTTDLG